ncbi:MBL fold metallo-hydrolase [Halomarina oriensis]|uniref:MBL fold metallo-hydrolase n=1 Tax=Halomarina oriensis TaxID=671145 RepID=A0A6B0GQK0_9EURY|nr:MBL fold metallo-hydrolase [Halomarina oriensis]MWG36351.1 MBL fold metallo-hydrolase [Halomarina oriensis]
MDRSCEHEGADGRADGRGSVAVHRIEFSIEWPPWTAAAYLVAGAEPTLVDAGVPGESGREELADGLAAHGYALGDVEHVLLTHPHSDHLGQVPALRDADATVYAADRTLDRLRRSEADLEAGVRETAHAVGLDEERVDSEVDRALDSLRRNRRLLPPEEVDVGFAFGEQFAAGGRSVTPLHTPGHQADHAAFALDLGDDRVLFSGDVLVEPFRAAALNVGLDRGAEDAVDDFYRAYDRLADHAFDRVHPGHGPVFETYDAVLAASLERLGEMVDDVFDAVPTDDAASPVAVTEARGKRLDPPAAMLDTVGALGSLDGQGRITRETVDGLRRYRRD